MENPKNIHPLTINCFFSSSILTEAITINCNIFNPIPDIPCPAVNDTIISRGKHPVYPKKPPEAQAFVKPINTTNKEDITLFAIVFIPKSIADNGRAIKKNIEPIIPIINSVKRENISFL